jgi:hypothetical protein
MGEHQPHRKNLLVIKPESPNFYHSDHGEHLEFRGMNASLVFLSL